MKEVIGQARNTQSLLPRKIIVNNIEINKEKRIANKFNNLINLIIGPELTKEISGPARLFESYEF